MAPAPDRDPFTDCARIDAVLTTAFDWRELSDFLALPACSCRCPARRVLRAGHRRVHADAAFRRRLVRFLDRRFLEVRSAWQAMPTRSRRHAALAARPEHFVERGVDPAAFLWSLLRDGDPQVAGSWRPFARLAFPWLRRRLQEDGRGAAS